MCLNIPYDHDAPSLNRALGISDERAREIHAMALDLLKRGPRVSNVVEELLSSDGLSDAEKAYALISIGFIQALGEVHRGLLKRILTAVMEA